MSHHILRGRFTQGASSVQGQSSGSPLHSDPVNIDLSSRNADADDVGYPGSSVEDEFFYSPRSSPTSISPMEGREAASPKTPAAPKERFFTPRAPTPEYVRKMVIIIRT